MTTTLCGASWYNQKYYLNPAFDKLPEDVRRELQIMAVEFTEDVGGVFTVEFGEDRFPRFSVRSAEGDPRFDEIGAELKIRKLQREKEALLEKLTLYYRLFVLGESVEKAFEGLELSEIAERVREESKVHPSETENPEDVREEKAAADAPASMPEPDGNSAKKEDASEKSRMENYRLLQNMLGEDFDDSPEEALEEEELPQPYLSPFERLAASDVTFVPLWPDDLEDEE